MCWIRQGFRFFIALAVLVAIRLLRATWRVVLVGPPPQKQCIYVFWHGDQVALLGGKIWPRLAILASRSRDGQIAAWVVSRLGFEAVRGSTSRGATAGALALLRRLKAGQSVAIAVDGPRGPRHHAGQSVVRIAALAKVDVVPIAAAAAKGFVFSSWDRLLLPPPFARVIIVRGPALRQELVQHGLDRAWHQAWMIAREGTSSRLPNKRVPLDAQGHDTSAETLGAE